METKKAKVIILPTEDNTGIVLHSTGLDKLLHIKESGINAVQNIGGKFQHLYITTDEKIKEGDWIITSHIEDKKKNPRICKVNSLKLPFTRTTLNVQGFAYSDTVLIEDSRKIIATTNIKLKDVAQIPQEFIRDYCRVGGIDEVLIKYVNSRTGGNSLSSNENGLCDEWKLKIIPNNITTIHPIKDSWNREEISAILHKYEEDSRYYGRDSYYKGIDIAQDWIEENL